MAATSHLLDAGFYSPVPAVLSLFRTPFVFFSPPRPPLSRGLAQAHNGHHRFIYSYLSFFPRKRTPRRRFNPVAVPPWFSFNANARVERGWKSSPWSREGGGMLYSLLGTAIMVFWEIWSSDVCWGWRWIILSDIEGGDAGISVNEVRGKNSGLCAIK